MDSSSDAVCTRCAEPKELPLARCGRCGHVPIGEERELAVLLSTRVLSPEQLAEAAARLRRGEPLTPSATLRARARTLLHGDEAPKERTLTLRELLALTAANLLLTPLLGYAVWLRLRERPGPAGRQALAVTVPVSLVLAAGVVAALVFNTSRTTSSP